MNRLTRFFIGFVILYLIWHLGRWYEFKQIQAQVKEAYQHSVDTYFFVDPSIVDPYPNAQADLFVEGELGVGRCFEPAGENLLLHYYPR